MQQAESAELDWGEKEWGTHRYHTRQLLEHAMEASSVLDRAAVLGAGNHGGVNLPQLARGFAQLTVLDTEANSIEEVLEQSGLGATANVKTLTNVDYTCLDQLNFYETWEDMLLNHTSAADIACYIKDCAFEARRHEALPHLKQSFDLVVSCSVHTQLFYIHALSQFAGYAPQYAEADIRQIVDTLSYLRNSLVEDYNRLLSSLLRPDGRLVMWSDMIRLSDENEQLLEQLYSLNSEQARIKFLFRAFGQHGIEPAVLGLKDLHDRVKQENQLFKCWVWLADKDKRYIAAGFSGRLR
ncbi:hypothetical protein CBW46_002100 [Paenibacillus xerothermodurans]|uniref:Class I SAM-dependent methyltransferase n=2 Tax=Paenibacillus xerothermodurans TaxID=1977292 RepID=A0A2W1NGQ9_PAEXE|nr:hypothetical protein CBW46_002100 [Paenibacillus xerothermodurans]